MKNSLLKLAKANKNLVVLSAGNSYCEDFSKFFPERHFVFGPVEANIISCAAGFAWAGKLPVVVGNANFLASRGFDQILNDICIPNLNVKIFAVGETDEILKKCIPFLPNLKVESVDKFKALDELMKEYGPSYVNLDEL